MFAQNSSSNSHNSTRKNIEALPAYSTGITIAPLTSQNAITSHLEIKLFHQSFNSCYDIGDVVYGSLILSPKRTIKVIEMTVVLSFDEVAKQTGWISDTYRSQKNYLDHFVIHLNLSPLVTLPGFIYTVPFSIQIPEIVSRAHNTHTNCNHLRLPPSLGSPSELNIESNNIENNAARINYKLKAVAKIFNDTLNVSQQFATAFEYIHVIPSYTLSEYDKNIVTRSPHSVTCCVSRKNGVLQSSFKETFLLELLETPLISMKETTVAVLSVLDTPSFCALPPKISNITIDLYAYTYYSEEPPKLNSFKLLSIKPSANTTWVKTRAQSFYTVFELPLTIPQKNKMIVPTFESCMVSRKYELNIEVMLQGCTKTLKLCMPINVIASLIPRSNEGLTANMENYHEYNKLPDYSTIN